MKGSAEFEDGMTWCLVGVERRWSLTWVGSAIEKFRLSGGSDNREDEDEDADRRQGGGGRCAAQHSSVPARRLVVVALVDARQSGLRCFVCRGDSGRC